MSLAGDLKGRNGVLSLSSQDVRAYAHGLVLELLEQTDPTRWPAVAERYYQCYDRGKPRRPTRLQRLYLEWSADQGPLGLLEAASSHPHLWEEMAAALSYQDPHDADRHLLQVVLQVRGQASWQPWLLAYRSSGELRGLLLRSLPLLPYPPLLERLGWLEEQARELVGAEDLLLACRLTTPPREPPSMPLPLVELCLALVRGHPQECDPRWLAVLRGYRWPASRLAKLRAELDRRDPVHRIVFGPRPGRPWLAHLLDELEAQALKV